MRQIICRMKSSAFYTWGRIFCRWCVTLCLCMWGIANVQAQPQTHGLIESVVYEPGTQTLTLVGWTLGGPTGHDLPLLGLDLNGEHHESRTPNWVLRADVRPDSGFTGGQQGIGFRWQIKLNRALPAGVHPLMVMVTTPQGIQTRLTLDKPEASFIVVQRIQWRHWALLAVMVVGAAAIAWGMRLTWPYWLNHLTRGSFAVALVSAVFLALVSLGITGSSVGILLHGQQGQAAIDAPGAQALRFGPQAVRGDEWGVLMPNVLAQWHHTPRFPVVNEQLGDGGQNMGVIGMTGAPVKQWAALARPATWGYFFLPLRQAMSWQWQLPFWGCLLAVWAMLNVLNPMRRGLNASLALVFCIAPYAAAWSNWPLYASMFPALAFAVLTRAFRPISIGRGLLLGAVLGWLGACWALVLYPAWIIIVGSLLALLAAGWMWDQRQQLHFGRAQVMACVSAGVVLLLLLGAWWLDTRDAVALMKATVYPGGRGAMPGGDLSWWWQLRGYGNVETMRDPGPATNASEASSYFLLPVLMLGFLVLSWMQRVQRGVLVACALFLAFYVAYAFVGIPIWLAEASLWGNMPTTRMDVGLGLLMVVLMAVQGSAISARSRCMPLSVCVLLSILSVCLVIGALASTDAVRMPSGSPIYAIAMAVAASTATWWGIKGRLGSAVVMLLLVSACATLRFNPIERAPQSVALATEQMPFATDSKGRFLRTVVVGDGIAAMTLAATGLPVSNGVFYYPHAAFWTRMQWPEAQWSIVNRYQHLGMYLLADMNEPKGYRVVNASLDQLHIHVHPLRFDFARTGAQRLAVEVHQAAQLNGNPSLQVLGEQRGLAWFAIVSPH